MQAHPNTVDPSEIAKFEAMAAEWWDPNGKFKPLHMLNPCRLDYIVQQISAEFGRDPDGERPFEGLRLLDIDLPQAFADAYPGPRFGIAGTRRLAGVDDRPLIGTIIKPSVGLTPEQTAALVDILAGADLDFIKDDELIASPPYSTIDARVAAVMPVIRRTSNRPYRWEIGETSLGRVANVEKKLPQKYIAADGFGITPAAKRYLSPLIHGEDYPPYGKDGLPQYVRMKKVLAKKKLPGFDV